MGNVTLNGSVSGSITIAPPSVAGTNTATLPAGTGTVIETVTNMAANPVTGTPSSSNYLRGDGTWAAISATGQLIRAPQILTSGTSYTTPSNCTSIYVEAVGGGAGGASVTNTGAGGGGGSGAYCAKYFTVTGSTAYSYAVGASAASNTAGNDTTFGPVSSVTITAGGGLVGSKTGSTAADCAIGGTGGAATNGDINSKGSSGMGAFLLSNGSIGGAGGSSVLGGGGNGRASTTGAGVAGANGGGGGGGMATTATSAAGGAGGAGLIRIWEYT